MASPWDGLLGKKADQLNMNPDPLLETATMGGYDTDAISKALSDENDPLARALYAQQLKAIEQQEKGIQGLESLKGELASKQPEIDLSPVIGFTDYLSGAQASKMYQKPIDAEDLSKLKFNLQNEIEKRKSGVTGDIADVLKSKLASKRAEQIALASGRQERFDTKRVQGLEKELGDVLDKRIIKPLAESEHMYTQLDKQLTNPTQQDVMQVLSIMARQIGQEKGAMSEGDVRRQVLTTLESDLAKLSQYLSGKSLADPDVLAQIRKTIDASKAAMNKSLKGYAGNIKNQYAAKHSFRELFEPGGYGIVGFEEAEKAIDRVSAPRGTTEPVSPPKGLTPEQEKRRQELLKKAGG